jgi:hypothetical protein
MTAAAASSVFVLPTQPSTNDADQKQDKKKKST